MPPVDAVLPEVRWADWDDVIVVRVVGAVGVCVAARPRAAVVAVVGVVSPPRPARTLFAPPTRGAASAPNPVIKNANIKRILFNGNPPIIYIILS